MSAHFIWDDKKTTANYKKHGISFDEAKSVFYDDYARIIHDPDHSENEERFIILGLSFQMNILTVVHCYREENGIIRLISARKATKSESKQYRSFLS